MSFISGIKQRARKLRMEMHALLLAAKHPATPWYAKLVVAGVLVYAVTPVDLVPDFIPILGIVDDIVFIPLALAFAVRFVPAEVLSECRTTALGRASARPDR